MKIAASYDNSTDLFADGFQVWGYLSDEHASCSYGQPVFVSEDGLAMGAAEVGTLTIAVGLDVITASALIPRAMAAGYRFSEGTMASLRQHQQGVPCPRNCE